MTLKLDRQCEDIVFEELERIAAAGTALSAVSEERGEVDARRRRGPCTGRHRSDRRLDERAPDDPLPLAVDRCRRRRFDGGRPLRLRPRLRRRRGVLGGPRRRRPPRRRPDRAAARARCRSRSSGSSPPIRAGSSARSRSCRARPTGSASIGSIAITLCYVACGRFDGMLSARGCRSVDAAAAQLDRPRGGLRDRLRRLRARRRGARPRDPLPGRRRPLGRPPRGRARSARGGRRPVRPTDGGGWPSSSTGTLARRIALTGIGERGPAMRGAPDLAATGERASAAVRGYTGLDPLEPLPEPEWVSRRDWIDVNLASVRELHGGGRRPPRERSGAAAARGRRRPRPRG